MTTFCNRCQSAMLPDATALVPALKCTNPQCARLISMTAVSHRKVGAADEKRALRAARRRKMALEG